MSDNLLMLLEMIEEVLEEQNNQQQIAKAADSIVIKAASRFGLSLPEDKTKFPYIYKLPEGEYDRQTPAMQINEILRRSPALKGVKNKEFLSSGRNKDIIGLTLYDGRRVAYRYAIKGSGTRINFSEVMESVIAEATGGDVGNSFDNDAKKKVRQDFIGTIQKSVGETTGLLGLSLKKLDKGQLSDSYKSFGVKSKTPKTDLIDPSSEQRYSVKSGVGAQFVSAQGPESAAIWNAAALATIDSENIEEAVKKSVEIVVTDEIINKFNYEQWSKTIEGKDQKQRKEVYDKIKQSLFVTILDKLGIKNNKDFMNNFIFEAMSGKQKFVEGDPAIANMILTWNTDGKPFKVAILDIDYVKGNNFNVRVSDRGGTRGGSIRGDILESLSRNSIIESQEVSDEQALEIVQQFIEKHNLSRDDLQSILNSIESLKEIAIPADGVKDDLDELIDLLGLDKVFGAIGSVLQAIPDIPDDIRMKSIAKGIAKSLLRGFKKDGLVKFLDQLNVANNGDTIDMEPLYKGLPVEFVDIEEPDEEIPMEET
jgi:hypothetical protein